MEFEAAFQAAGIPNLFSDEYDRFAAKWDSVRSTFTPNYWFWSGNRQRWEWLPPDQYDVKEAGLEVVTENRNQHAMLVFPAVEKSWARVRTSQPEAMWNPRNGGWFVWTRRHGNPPAPPPIPPVPTDVWTQRMNEELAAIENLKLSPAEKQLARDAVRKRYLGQ